MEASEPVSGSNAISAYILFIVIAAAPLPLGSRDATTVAVWCFVLGAALLFASPRHLRRGHFALLAGLGLIVACYGFVLHEQLSDHPWIAAPDPIWARASELLGRSIRPSVSVVRGEPFYAVGPTLAAVLALTLGLVVGADKRRANQALFVMAWAGVAYAIYGIVALIFGLSSNLEDAARVQPDSLTATFVNRNTAAPYLGSCAVVWLVLLMATIRGRLQVGLNIWSHASSQFFGETGRQVEWVLPMGMFIVCLAAMFMTGSRGGVLTSLFAFVVAIVLFFRRDLPRGKSLIVLVAGAAELALLLLQIMGGQVEGRIDVGGLSDQGRLAAYRSTLRLIADHPWFGTGLGTFASIFPAYRSGDISIAGIWDKAHSTPLELAAELGIPLALLIAAGWLVALLAMLHGTRRSRRETVVPLAALGVCLIALLHSSIDFSLQVPGYAIVVFAVAGVGLGQSFHDVSDNSERRRRRRSKSRQDENPPAAAVSSEHGKDAVTAEPLRIGDRPQVMSAQ